jgi:fluoride exporter
MNTALLMLGAAIGAPLRFVIDQYLRKFSNAPWGTFTVNVLGSFVLGLTWSASENTLALIAIGFAGAFTTWSTFVLDIYLAFELKKFKVAAINYAGSLLIGLLAAAAAINLVA